MTRDYDSSAQQEWLDGLDEERLSTALETIASLPAEQRRAALASPLPYLEQAGVRPPAGIEVELVDEELDPTGFRHLRQRGLEPPRLVRLCSRICWNEPWIVRGRTIGLRRVCTYSCV